MNSGALGKVYDAGQVIVQQGEVGDRMYVVQAGQVEVVHEDAGQQITLAVLTKGDVFGEMALFDKEVRSATVRARGEVRVLTVDKRVFMKNVHEDPSLAFRILQRMSKRIRDMDAELARARASVRGDEPARKD